MRKELTEITTSNEDDSDITSIAVIYEPEFAENKIVLPIEFLHLGKKSVMKLELDAENLRVLLAQFDEKK